MHLTAIARMEAGGSWREEFDFWGRDAPRGVWIMHSHLNTVLPWGPPFLLCLEAHGPILSPPVPQFHLVENLHFMVILINLV